MNSLAYENPSDLINITDQNLSDSNPPDLNPPEKHWERAIVSIKIQTFFSSIEQLDNPDLKNRPIGIINDHNGKLLFCCSQEADQLGIRKGMKINDAKRLSPSFTLAPARYERYNEVSKTIIATLAKITPNIEVNAINQLYLDITNVQQAFGAPENIVEHIEQTILRSYPSLSFAIGLAGDKTTASYAANSKDGHGISIIHPCFSEQRLSNIPLARLDGVSHNTASFLARRGIHRCGDMKHIDIDTLVKHFGSEGKRLWFMTQGLDPSPVRADNPVSKTISETKLIQPKNASDFCAVKNSIKDMCRSLSKRLQAEQLQTYRLHVAISLENGGWIGKTYELKTPIHNGEQMHHIGLKLLMGQWRNEAITRLKICALNLKHVDLQTELFSQDAQ